MAWTCPECGLKHDTTSECSCGYSFYKILGVKPDDSEKVVKNAYHYHINVYKKSHLSDDPISQQKARERLKEINQAYDNFKLYRSNLPREQKSTSPFKIALIAAVIIVLVVVSVIFLIPFNNLFQKQTPEQEIAAVDKESSPQISPVEQLDSLEPRDIQRESGEPEFPDFEEASLDEPEALPELTEDLAAGLSPEEAKDKAIELVKKSHAVDRFFDVETLMNKWSEKNADTLQVIGWQAKKMDDDAYIVSYTASDGLATKGFYFDINMKTGTVKDLAKNPALQKKYGIQY